MTKLFDVLYPEVQEDLIRDHVIERVTVLVAAVPDPERPDDRLAMKIFRGSWRRLMARSWIDDELDHVRALCDPASEDLSIAVRDDLHVALNRRRKELDGIKEEIPGANSSLYISSPRIVELLRQSLENPIIDVLVGAIAGWWPWMMTGR